MIEDNRPVMVTIRCLVYNHEAYIRQCVEGFVMQQTNFRFEAIVHDDASTDGSAAIIREYAEKYPDIIKPIFQKENQYSKKDGSIARILNAQTRGKYIAYCEGDDYWTDSLKLQKQVDFLESHPEYVMCSHFFKNFIQEKNQFGGIGPISENADLAYDFNYYVNRDAWITHPLSVVYLRSALDVHSYLQCANRKDLTLFYFILKSGKGFLMKDIMAVYRIHSKGVWSGASRQKRVSDDLNCINGIYEVEKDSSAALLMKNYLMKCGYLGVTFFRNYMKIYKVSLCRIYKQLGFRAAFSVLWHNIRYVS